MTTRKRAAVVILALLIVLIGASGWSVYGAWRQAQKNAELIAAIQKGDFAAADALLDKGADPNAREVTDKRTFWQRIRDMVLHKTRQDIGRPALALALQSYSAYDTTTWMQMEPMVLGFIKQGADPNVYDHNGMTPLIWGCLYDEKPLVQMALAHGAEVNRQNEIGWTPLRYAVHSGDTALILTLFKHGANVNIKDDKGYTTLMSALYSPDPSYSVVRMLLEHGAEINVKNPYGGSTPLMEAVSAKRPDLVKTLLEHGAKANVKDDYDRTPLKLAIKAKRPDLVSLLKQYGAKQ